MQKGQKMPEKCRKQLIERLKGHIVSKETRRKISLAKSGVSWGKHSKKTKKKLSELKKGIKFSPEHKRNISKARKGNKCAWKGDFAGYRAMHNWIVKMKGKPKYCEICRRTDKRIYHWANVDHKYRRRLKDYIRLCPKCHAKYDRENNNKVFHNNFNN